MLHVYVCFRRRVARASPRDPLADRGQIRVVCLVAQIAHLQLRMRPIQMSAPAVCVMARLPERKTNLLLHQALTMQCMHDDVQPQTSLKFRCWNIVNETGCIRFNNSA